MEKAESGAAAAGASAAESAIALENGDDGTNRAVSRSSCRWLNLRSGMHAHGKVDTPERQARILPADSTGSGRLLEFRELGLLAVALNLLLISGFACHSRDRDPTCHPLGSFGSNERVSSLCK